MNYLSKIHVIFEYLEQIYFAYLIQILLFNHSDVIFIHIKVKDSKKQKQNQLY